MAGDVYAYDSRANVHSSAFSLDTNISTSKRGTKPLSACCCVFVCAVPVLITVCLCSRMCCPTTCVCDYVVVKTRRKRDTRICFGTLFSLICIWYFLSLKIILATSKLHRTSIISLFFGRGLRLQERRSGQRNVHCKQGKTGGSVWDRNQSLCRVRGRELLRRDQRVVYERRREPSNCFGSFRRLLGIILLVEKWSHGSTRRVPWD